MKIYVLPSSKASLGHPSGPRVCAANERLRVGSKTARAPRTPGHERAARVKELTWGQTVICLPRALRRARRAPLVEARRKTSPPPERAPRKGEGLTQPGAGPAGRGPPL